MALSGSETKRMDQTEKHNLQSNGQGTLEQHKYGRTDRPWRHRGFVAAGSERAKALVATPLHRLGSEKVSILHPKPCDFHSWVLNTQNCAANTNTVETNRSSAAASSISDSKADGDRQYICRTLAPEGGVAGWPWV